MSLTPAQAQVRAAGGIAYLVAAVVVLFAEVGLYVFMTYNGHGSDFTGMGLLLTPVVLALFVKAGVDMAAAPQNVTLATIQHQTNGVLAQKIRDGVREVMAERDAIAAAATYAPGTAPALPSFDPTADPAGAFAPEPAPAYDDVPATAPAPEPAAPAAPAAPTA